MKRNRTMRRVLALLLCLFLISCQKGDGAADTTDSVSDERGSFGINDGSQDRDPALTDGENEPKDTDTQADTADTEESVLTEGSEMVSDTEEISAETESDTEADTEAVVQPDDDSHVVIGGREVIDLSNLLTVEASVAGRFISYQNDHLRLVVDYDCYMAQNGNVTIEFAIGLECYELYCGPRNHMGKIMVDGVSHTFSTDVIDHQERTLLYVPFTTHTYQSGSSDSCMIDVTWGFNGTYGEAKIGTLAASALFEWSTPDVPGLNGDDTTPADTTEETPDTTAAPDTEEHTTPVTEPITEPITESITEPMTEPITEPITEPMTEPVTEPDTEEIVIETDAQTTEVGSDTEILSGEI